MLACGSERNRRTQRKTESEKKRDAKKENVWSESKSVPVRVRGRHRQTEKKRKCV